MGGVGFFLTLKYNSDVTDFHACRRVECAKNLDGIFGLCRFGYEDVHIELDRLINHHV